MINLLPSQTKQDIAYARLNTKLLRWSFAILASLLGAGLIIGFGLIFLDQSARSYTKQIEEGETRLRIQKLEETQTRVTDISGSLKLVVQVLSKEILFSKVLRQVGSAIPSGSVLTGLSIEQVSGGINLQFEAKDYQTGSQIAVNLQDKDNKIFEKADIESIVCDPLTEESEQTYACLVKIRALFGDNSPYLFINDGKQQ